METKIGLANHETAQMKTKKQYPQNARITEISNSESGTDC
jgi:hypothetical protein